MSRAIVLSALVLLTGCPKSGDAASSTASSSASSTTASAPAGDVERYSAHGVVKSVEKEKKKLSIAHDDIPNFMKAMTMPFEVKDAALLDGIAAGDTVDFSFTDDGSGHLVIDKITKK